MATINLFGASGHAKVIIDVIKSQGNSVGVLFDDAPRYSTIHGRPVYRADEADVCGPLIISTGSNKARRDIALRYNVPFASAVYPSAIVSGTAQIGPGTVVMQGAIVQTDAVIGKHCIINTGSSVDHECQIGDYVHISPHATLCGNVHVGEGSWIGAGAVVIPGIKIGKWCTIGAGSVVIRDVPDGSTAYGNPARVKSK